MPPEYEDDDVVEDYQEVSSDSGVRRVQSGQGGPVQRPNGRPATSSVKALPDQPPAEGEPAYDPNKGKITKSSAKLIWIICIAVSVLGVAAVAVDKFIDPLDRHKAPDQGGGGSTDGGNNPPANNRRNPELTPRQKAEREFMNAVVYKIKEMDSSKAWDFYWLRNRQFDDAYDKALATKKKEGVSQEELDEAWAIAIKYYYQCKYGSDLFRTHFDPDKLSENFLGMTLDAAGMEQLSDDDLKDAKIRTCWAAHLKIDDKSTNVNMFKTDVLRYDMGATKVHEAPEWAEKHFGMYRDQWKDAAEKGAFVQEDLDFVNGPDYQAGEKKMYEEYLESRDK